MSTLFIYVIGPICSLIILAVMYAAMSAGSRADDENEALHKAPKKDRDE
ncbi:hypothetical protein [Pleomorphomonas sp. PLEO]